MRKILYPALLALSTLVLAIPVSGAAAQDVQFELGPDGPSMRLRDRCDPRYDDCYEPRGHDRRDDWREGRRDECSPDRALRKAERMGIRRARVESVGRRTITVIGRSRGDRVIVTFDRRDRWCPVVR